jgi:hypothetical protein
VIRSPEPEDLRKHIYVILHHVRERQNAGYVHFAYVPSADNVPAFEQHKESMRLSVANRCGGVLRLNTLPSLVLLCVNLGSSVSLGSRLIQAVPDPLHAYGSFVWVQASGTLLVTTHI